MLDVPQLLRDYQMASEQHYKPPSYPPSAHLDPQQQQQLPQHEIHNHWHQTTAPIPSRKPWHRRRGCVTVVGLVSVFLLIAISVAIALAVVYTLKNRDSAQDDAAASLLNSLTTTETSTSTTSSTSSSSEFTSETLPTSTTVTPWESIVTVIITASESSEAVETETATLTVTAEEEEDLGAILSSMLSDFPQFSITTEVVTVSVTPTQSTTSTTSSTTSTTSTAPTSLSTTDSSSPPTTSTTTPTSSLVSTAPPAIATDSSLAALYLNPDSARARRILIWQDESTALIASDIDSSAPAVYRLADHSSSDLPRAQQGTPLTGVMDDSGVAHLFYLADDGSVAHLVQQQLDTSSWEAQGRSRYARPNSSLSAVWHASNSSSALVLAYQDPKDNLFLLYGAEQNDEEDSVLINLGEALSLTTGDWDRRGLAVTSAEALGEDADEGTTGVQILIEGTDDVLVAECLMVSDDDGSAIQPDCYWLPSIFLNNKGKPIPISSHPMYLSWLTTDGGGGVPTIRGFFTLEDEGHLLTNHQLVPGQASEIVSYGIAEGQRIESIVMTTRNTVFARMQGTQVWEVSFDGDDWAAIGQVDTTLTE